MKKILHITTTYFLYSFSPFSFAGSWFYLSSVTGGCRHAFGFMVVRRGGNRSHKNTAHTLAARRGTTRTIFFYHNNIIQSILRKEQYSGDYRSATDDYFYSTTSSTTSRKLFSLGSRKKRQGTRRQVSCRLLLHPRSQEEEEEKKVQRNDSPTSPSDINNGATWIHIGNINWYLPSEKVERYFMSDFFENLPILTFYLKPKSNKPRDEGKFHGGSVKIEFETNVAAQQAMERMQQRHCHEKHDSESSIGQLRFHWITVNPPQHFEKRHENMNQSSTVERIQHRKYRAEKYARQRLRKGQETDALLKILEPLWEVRPTTVMDVLDAPELDWDSVPSPIDPIRGGGLRQGTPRGSRKQAQVEAILYVLRTLFQDIDQNETESEKEADDPRRKIVIADLASGAGNLSLPLAWFFKDIDATVLAVDINPRALERLKKRAADIGVKVQTLVRDLEELTSLDTSRGEAIDYLMKHNCQAIVSLHACGAASDLAIEAAVAHDLPFVVSPCCIAKANQVRDTSGNNSSHSNSMLDLNSSQRSGAPVRITYPRSKELETFCLEHSLLNDYPLIMTAADYSVGEKDQNHLVNQKRGKMSKHIVDLDRLKWAEERGYYVRIMNIPRLGIYPKKELLLGARRGSKAAERLSLLPTNSA